MPVDTLAPVVSQKMPSDVGGARLQAKPALPSRRRDRTAEAIRQQQHTLMLIDQTINDRATLLLQKMNDENIRAALDEIGTRDRTLKRAGEAAAVDLPRYSFSAQFDHGLRRAAVVESFSR